MQTILGSGGAIGTDLARELTRYTSKIRLASRNPKKVNDNDELFPADLTKADEVAKAIEGSDIVYVTIGFPYSVKVWQNTWPPFIKSVISGCKKYGAKLVFFDNVYMYDKDHIPHMTEETPVNPSSKKGKVRAEVANLIMESTKKGDIEALIARAPDFYGTRNSVLTEMAIKNIMKGKTGSWFVSADKVHNFIYTPDAAKATALLGNTPDAYNQVWHLPTTHKKYTVREWIELHARELGTKPKISTMPIWMMSLVGLFIPILKEFKEMVYQSDRDYFFDSSKFEKRFNVPPTEPEVGVKQVVEELKKTNR